MESSECMECAVELSVNERFVDFLSLIMSSDKNSRLFYDFCFIGLKKMNQ